MVVDLKDPNRPRFTMQELKEVLQERNQLKAHLLIAQEELQLYKRFETLSHTLLLLSSFIHCLAHVLLHPHTCSSLMDLRPLTLLKRLSFFFYSLVLTSSSFVLVSANLDFVCREGGATGCYFWLIVKCLCVCE